MPESSSLPPIDLNAIDRVAIDLGDRSYAISIARNLLQHAGAWRLEAQGADAVVVSNPTVFGLHGEALVAALSARHARVLKVLLPDGESFKTWASVDAIVTTMLEAACDRRTTLYALGGGVVGDVTGFAASCYMRGVPFVQVPTTLLAQVDSSVGGKTAINHALGKNMVGAFYQPVAVLCDLATLDTLPDREYRSGLAEVIKYGPIADANFLAWLEANMPALLQRDGAALAHAVRRSCEIKAHVVGADEREGGLRAILNFGHTFGHAIEAAMGYGVWLHGEAVACGMVIAASLSAELGGVTAADALRLRRLIEAAQLPSVPPEMAWDTWLRWMRVDKKAEAQSIRYVVLDGVGRARMQAVPDATVRAVIERLGHTSAPTAAVS